MRAAHANVSRQGPRRLLLAWLCSLCLVTAARAQPTYDNPVVAGDFPDPTVIRTGQDYWAATTSGGWAPLFQILHSRDLVNWRVAGSVFRESPDWPTWARGDYWAPELSEHRGRFYVYYTARRAEADRRGTLCVAVASAGAPAGPYTDHGPLVCQEAGSIDAYATTDERGRRYLLWKEDGNDRNRPTPIWAQPLSEDGLKLEGEPKELIRNDATWERHVVEGPYVFRRGGWFYLFYSGNACCGRGCNYALGVARSQKLLGPWEKFSGNPIMTGNESWKCPGHGTVVDDGRGRHFYMYHAYHPRDFVYVGRQALVDEITWGPDGWPTINAGRGPSSGIPSPHGAADLDAEYSFADEFRAARIDAGWQWPQANVPRFRVEPARGGWLALAPARANEGDPLGAVLGRPTTRGDYVATAALDARGMGQGVSAGLSAYGDAENALGLSVTAGRVVLWRREKKEHRELASVGAPRAARLQLRMTAREGRLYRFAVSADGRDWTDVGGEQDGSYLPPWDRGVRVALVAGGGAASRFDWLRLVASPR